MINMDKVAVIYWSGTGNTEAMATFIAEGVKSVGAGVELFSCHDFNASSINNYSAVALGCPAMGAEELEENEFKPMWDSIKDSLNGKRVILFGSYGWGTGEWMQVWEEEAPCNILQTYICNEYPDDDAKNKCLELGKALANK